MARLVDLSHEVGHGTLTYPGLPGPVITDFMSREESRPKYGGQAEFHIGRIEMVANTGTYVDAPFHRYPDGADLAGLPLERLAHLEGLRVPVGSLAGVDVAGKAVLIHTGWDRHWGTPQYFEGHPFLTRAEAQRLVAAGAALVGIDSLNIDDTSDPARPAHTLLLGAGIPIVEHLCNLQMVPEQGFPVLCGTGEGAGAGQLSGAGFRGAAVIRADDHIELAILEERDAEELYALADANRERLRQWLPWVDGTRSPDDVRRFIRQGAADYHARKAIHLGIRVDGALAGAVGCSRIVEADRRAEIGYWIAAGYEGRAVVTRSCRALITWLFREFGLHRIEIHCAPENRRSAAIPARLGFTREALLREAHRVGERFDNVEIWGLLKREWRGCE